jgi:hypothetical protein
MLIAENRIFKNAKLELQFRRGWSSDLQLQYSMVVGEKHQ